MGIFGSRVPVSWDKQASAKNQAKIQRTLDKQRVKDRKAARDRTKKGKK